MSKRMILCFVVAFFVVFAVTACAPGEQVEEQAQQEEEPQQEEEQQEEETPEQEERTDENDSDTWATMPGLSASEVFLFAQERGLECTSSPSPYVLEGREGMTDWNCSRQEGDDLEDDIEYELFYVVTEDNEVLSGIEATVLTFTGQGLEPVAAEYLAEVAALPGEATDPAQARQWVMENIASDQVEEATFGRTYYALRGTGASVTEIPTSWGLEVEVAD